LLPLLEKSHADGLGGLVLSVVLEAGRVVLDWLTLVVAVAVVFVLLSSVTTEHERQIAPPALLGGSFLLMLLGFFPSARPDVIDLTLMLAIGLTGVAVSAYLARRIVSPTFIRAYREAHSARQLRNGVLEIVVVVIATTMGFAVFTAVFVELGLIAIAPELAGHHRDMPTLILFGVYAWSLCNAIPVLDVAETLRWEYGYRLTGHSGGFFVLAYKVLAAIPIVQLARLLIESARQQPQARTPVDSEAGRAASEPPTFRPSSGAPGSAGPPRGTSPFEVDGSPG
jgi:hypothetical protein